VAVNGYLEGDFCSPNIIGQHLGPVSPVAELNVEIRIPDESQSVPISEPNDCHDSSSHTSSHNRVDQFEVVDIPDDDEDLSSAIIGNVLLDQTEDANILDDDVPPLELLNKDICVIRQLQARGERSKAKLEYCKAIRTYVNRGGQQSGPLITCFLTELLERFNSCTDDDVPTSAYRCLELLQGLGWPFSSISSIRPLVSSALDRLLRSHPGVPQGINIHQLITATNNRDFSEPFHVALRLSLERMPVALKTPGILDREKFRLSLLAFGCDLKEYLNRMSFLRSRTSDVGFSNLRETTLQLWLTSKTLDGGFDEIRSRIGDINSIFDRLSKGEVGGEELDVRTSYSSMEPSITYLASACSAAGWIPEAETLFAVVRSTQSLRKVFHTRMTEISIQYCQHRERQRAYTKLLSVVHDGYKEIGNVVRFLAPGGELRQIFWMRNTLNKVPRPLDQYISSALANDTIRQDNMLSEAAPIFLSWTSETDGDEGDEDVENMDNERDHNEDKDEDEQVDDSKSSNKFGVTYTESLMTGISFNYSDLYRRN
jgi:hypothetical protein